MIFHSEQFESNSIIRSSLSFFSILIFHVPTLERKDGEIVMLSMHEGMEIITGTARRRNLCTSFDVKRGKSGSSSLKPR